MRLAGRFDWLATIYAVFWLAVGVLVVALTVSWLQRPWEPLHDYGMAEMVNAETLNDDGYAIVALERCNREGQPVHVTSATTFAFVDGFQFSVPADSSVLTLPPGCSVSMTRYALPNGLFPGDWRVVGLDVGLGAEGRRQNMVWRSPVFTVGAPQIGGIDD